MTIVSYDRGYMRGLIEAVEHGDDVRRVEFFEHAVIEGLVTPELNRTPDQQIDAYLRTALGQTALASWAKSEAIDEALYA